MRKSLAEIQQIEHYLDNRMSGEDRQAFEAAMLLSDDLQDKVQAQRVTYQLVHWFSRKARKQQLERIHASLMKDASFSHTIKAIFR